MTAEEAYYARFRKVLEHIDAQLDDDLSVERLRAVAAFSKFHFHRQFSALFGMTVHKYVQLVRLRRASYQLAYRAPVALIDIALASGYESHEAFSRAFKKTVGQTPSEFRERPLWQAWHATYQPLSDLRNTFMKPEREAQDVTIVAFPETKVALLEHRGDPRLLGDTIRNFIAWRKQNHLPPQRSATFNLLYKAPNDVAPEDFRLDLCAATEHDVKPNELGVVTGAIPAGRCARLRHVGSEEKLFQAVGDLYASWLPSSGEELRDFPIFLQRLRWFPDVPEPEAVTDIFLPLV